MLLRLLTCALSAASLALTALPIFAQGPSLSSVPPPTGLPIHQTFSTNSEGWSFVGNSASVTVAPKESSAGGLDGALTMDYQVGPGKTAALLLSLGAKGGVPGVLKGAQSFRFKVRSDYATELFFSLQEKSGGRYVATFSVPKDAWQTVELAPGDFVLTDGPGADKDRDNKLDLAQVQWLGMADAGTIFSQLDDTRPYDISKGQHHLSLADFQIAATPLPDAASKPSPDSLDAFIHPQLDWMVFGAERAEVAHNDLLPGQGMTVHYVPSSDTTVNMVRTLPLGKLSGAYKISFLATSLQTVTLVVQLEDSKGNQFRAPVVLSAERVNLKAFSVPITDFTPIQSDKNPNAKLDLAQIHRIEFIAVANVLKEGSLPVENTLYIGDLRVSR